MTIVIILLGFAFGLSLQYSKVNTYNTISGMAILEDLTVAKTIATAIGIGAILLSIEIGFGFASYHIKTFFVGSVIVGGFIFGIGMSILGYCPGTMPVSIGQGSIDALIGMMGGLVASLVYTILSPFIHEVLGPDLGKLSLSFNNDPSSILHYLLVLIIGSAFIGIAFWMNKFEKKTDTKWFYSGLGIALVTCIIFAASDRVLGASTLYPFIADKLTGYTDNPYFIKVVEKSGLYEMKFLFGAFLSGLILSILKKEFRLTLIHENWSRFKGNSSKNRIVWSFIGGFILLFGARLASGCTSGHIISGGMQLAVSSLVFAIFVFGGFLITGKLFYRNQ
ncbi:MAG: YeeE/YedE thiosulfate transporter family protein [Bacteroidota bacterium]